MKFRIFSIFAGIGQAMAMFACVYVLIFIMYEWVPREWGARNALGLTAIMALILCTFIGVVYPVHLFRQRKKWDAFVVLASTLVSLDVGFVCARATMFYLG